MFNYILASLIFVALGDCNIDPARNSIFQSSALDQNVFIQAYASVSRDSLALANDEPLLKTSPPAISYFELWAEEAIRHFPGSRIALPEKYLKPFVFGGLDGISTMFAFLAGAVGADLGISHVVAIGCAQLFAGAIGMGLGEYLSAEAEQAVAKREQGRERREAKNNPEGEISKMVQLYTEKGMSQEDASIVAKTLSKYQDFWVEHMMLLPPEEENLGSVIQGVVMFFSFMLIGGLPLLAYILAHNFSSNETCRAWAAGLSASAALLLLGVIKAHMSDTSIWKGGLCMTIQGLLCAFVAYFIGDTLPNYFNFGDGK
jgi:DNA damage-binding protein 1